MKKLELGERRVDKKLAGIKKYAVQKDISGKEIKEIRTKMKLTQLEFAGLVNVSVKTVERWETSEQLITGPIVALLCILKDNPMIVEQLMIPVRKLPLRLWYMCGKKLCTLIDVDERKEIVEIF